MLKKPPSTRNMNKNTKRHIIIKLLLANNLKSSKTKRCITYRRKGKDNSRFLIENDVSENKNSRATTLED